MVDVLHNHGLLIARDNGQVGFNSEDQISVKCEKGKPTIKVN